MVSIELSKLKNEKIVIEDINNNYASIFQSVYVNAKEILKRIEEQNVDIKNLKNNNFDNHVCNTISFEGKRGTGKTSAMMSFKKNLIEKRDFISSSNNHQYVEIDYIDASTLEKNESIIHLILANMFQKLKKHPYNKYENNMYFQDETRELFKLFEDIFGILIKMQNDGRFDEVSPLSVLNQLSSSQMLQSKIVELVVKYLKHFGNDNASQFLIITIDDLDMHINGENVSPFDMLEELHRYFMIPGVIILLTYNFTDLCLACDKHFAQIYSKRSGNLSEDEKENIHIMTVDYLKKVLPLQNRVYLPSIINKDYFYQDYTIKVKLTKDDLKKIFDDYEINKPIQEDIYITPKQFVFLFRLYLADLYYDSEGNKKHFIEASDIRELSQLYRFYMQLKTISKHEIMEEVINKALMDDLYNRSAKLNLSINEIKRFEHYLHVPIERRSKDILNDIRNYAELDKINISEIHYNEYAEKSYSYGELMYCLYRSSRENWFSKKLVCCILDSYTIIMTEFYKKMKYSKDKKIKNQYYNRLCEVMGCSIASSWSVGFIPMVSLVSNKDEPTNLVDYRIMANQSSIYNAAAIKYAMTNVSFNIELETNPDDEQQELQVQLIEILCMFFTDVFHRTKEGKKEKGFLVEYSYLKDVFSKIKDTSGKRGPVIKISFTEGCFNIMNFVYNLFLGEKYFDQLHNNICGAYIEYLDDICEINVKKSILYSDSINNYIDKYSLFAKKECKKWYNDSYGMAMPLYSFDMMYNVLKRQYQKRNNIPKYTLLDNLWGYIERAYLGIGELLEMEDKFYFDNDLMKCFRIKNKRFSEIYNKCPFLNTIQSFKKNDNFWKKFEYSFSNMIFAIVQSR